VRLPGRNLNDIVLSQPPVFRITTSQSLYVYSVADPPLVQGLEYVWRVQARDRDGRDDFRNNGYSEVCTFTYGGSDDPAFAVGMVPRFRATGTVPQAGRMQWMGLTPTGSIIRNRAVITAGRRPTAATAY